MLDELELVESVRRFELSCFNFSSLELRELSEVIWLEFMAVLLTLRSSVSEKGLL